MCSGQIRFGLISTNKVRPLLDVSTTRNGMYIRMASNFNSLIPKKCFIEDKKYESSTSSVKDPKISWIPTQNERQKLVRYGLFKSVNDIPEELPPSTYKRFQGRLRFIQLSIFSIIFFTIVFASHFIASSYLNRAEERREVYLDRKRAEQSALYGPK
ncbi:hypothetical protein Mgra_00000756 [Meloidogyne graminicola]|uniref:Uncharacterized protein n=1 Tax=Meloidogyne graminicola TaxID=189291 RepID=A0A8T0A3D8_9BILA|nr:hypothetical protein Mgra_00000756 [Meloidogyne graminicola]